MRPFPEGEPQTEYRPFAALRPGAPARSAGACRLHARAVQGPFTIMNDPVKSPILETMLQRTCTGTVVRSGIRNHPAYGMRVWAQAIFFRKPDGTPWVKFYAGGFPSLSPVTEVGKMLQWAGRIAYRGKSGTFGRFSTPYGLTAITISVASRVAFRLILLASCIITMWEDNRSYLRNRSLA